jgi:hypothetical protein
MAINPKIAKYFTELPLLVCMTSTFQQHKVGENQKQHRTNSIFAKADKWAERQLSPNSIWWGGAAAPP